jgi:hypothetical protein
MGHYVLARVYYRAGNEAQALAELNRGKALER